MNQNLSLFPESSDSLVPKLVVTSAEPLTKEQKALNALIKKLEARRARLLEWNEAIPRFRQGYVNDLLPLQTQELELNIGLASALDRAYGQKGITKTERRKLSAMIVDLAEEVLTDRDHAEMKALYNQHSESDFDAEQAAERDEMKSVLEGIFGVELEDDDLDSPELVMERLHSHFQAQSGAERLQPKPRKKSAKALAREAQREAEEKQMSQSIRDVYRSLVRALHPDREPDPVERERKTVLLQEVNDAYDKGNLLKLLELQLQLEQIDASHLAGLAPQRLKHYTEILKKQLGELEKEIKHVEFGFAEEFGLSPFERLEPKKIMQLIASDTIVLNNRLAQLKHCLSVTGDLKQLKAWLKVINPHRRPAPDFDIPF